MLDDEFRSVRAARALERKEQKATLAGIIPRAQSRGQILDVGERASSGYTILCVYRARLKDRVRRCIRSAVLGCTR